MELVAFQVYVQLFAVDSMPGVSENEDSNCLNKKESQ